MEARVPLSVPATRTRAQKKHREEPGLKSVAAISSQNSSLSMIVTNEAHQFYSSTATTVLDGNISRRNSTGTVLHPRTAKRKARATARPRTDLNDSVVPSPIRPIYTYSRCAKPKPMKSPRFVFKRNFTSDYIRLTEFSKMNPSPLRVETSVCSTPQRNDPEWLLFKTPPKSMVPLRSRKPRQTRIKHGSGTSLATRPIIAFGNTTQSRQNPTDCDISLSSLSISSPENSVTDSDCEKTEPIRSRRKRQSQSALVSSSSSEIEDSRLKTLPDGAKKTRVETRTKTLANEKGASGQRKKQRRVHSSPSSSEAQFEIPGPSTAKLSKKVPESPLSSSESDNAGKKPLRKTRRIVRM